MKAIILAAGEGKRLRPLTEDRPKCLVPWRGRPLLLHTLERLRGAGIDDVTLVTGHRAEKLTGLGLTLRHNPDFGDTNMVHSLFCAEDRLEGEVLVVYGDILFADRTLSALLASRPSIGVAIDPDWRALWELRMDDPLADAETLRLAEDGRIREIGRRPRSYAEIEGQYMGLVRLDADGSAAVRDHHARLRAGRDAGILRRMAMTDLLQELVDAGVPVHAVPVPGPWIEIDTHDDLAAYERAGIVI